MPTADRPAPRELSVPDVVEAWWPLAASWLLMGLELPAVSAVMARLPDPKLSLAAYGGVVFPLCLLIESPIIMLLAASTALSRDWGSYLLVRRFMFIAASALTLLHVLVAFTPLYGLVVGGLLGAPPEILEPARRGLQIMIPWTLSIAYRRFQQGILIRNGRARQVGVGTAVRLTTNGLVLAAGYAFGRVPGIVVGTTAVAAGVMSEAAYAAFSVRPVLRNVLRRATPIPQALTLRAFLHFYVPLAVTPLIAFVAMPLASAAMNRMPLALASLAAWPVINGLVFALRSVGFAANEVVVSLLDSPRATRALRRFTGGLALITTGGLVVAAASPLGRFWFARVSALPPDLVGPAALGLWLSFAMPALSAYQSWYQGALVHSHRTRGVSESVFLYLATIGLALGAGVAFGRIMGLYVALVAMVAGNAVQVVWLRVRAHETIRAIEAREAREAGLAPAGAPPPPAPPLTEIQPTSPFSPEVP